MSLRTHTTALGYAAALTVHAGFIGALVLTHGSFPRPDTRPSLSLRLKLPPEREERHMLVASMPQPVNEPDPTPAPPQLAPEETPVPTPVPTPQPNLPPPSSSEFSPEVMQQLAAEREQLKQQLDTERQKVLTDADSAAQRAISAQAKSLQVAAGPVGTIRELDFSGWPKNIVDDMMRRYDLQIVHRKVTGGSNQEFLSSAASATGDMYYADRSNPGGYSEVFELSRQSVAVMSRLEEEEIKRRNLDLARTRVTRVKFGIVQTGPNQYDLGILEFEAQAIP